MTEAINPDDMGTKAHHYTPNVGIGDPRVRKIVNAVFSAIGIAIAVAMAVDGASPHLDWSAWTLPAAAGVGALSAYGIVVTQPNIPSK